MATTWQWPPNDTLMEHQNHMNINNNGNNHLINGTAIDSIGIGIGIGGGANGNGYNGTATPTSTTDWNLPVLPSVEGEGEGELLQPAEEAWAPLFTAIHAATPSSIPSVNGQGVDAVSSYQ
jgi:hypothetical protein